MALQHIVIVLFLHYISSCICFTAASVIMDRTNKGSCRGFDGEPICCSGKQVSCRGVARIFTSYYSYSKLGYQENGMKSMTPLPPNCFCDEFCVHTNDCCWDYRQACAKPKIDCKVSSWGRWSPCNNTCGVGSQMRFRVILKDAENGGEQCPLLKENRACQGYMCNRRRVGRSGSRMMRYMDVTNEVANLLPVRGNIQNKIRRFDMRWDIRRSLYLIQLIKQNKTEVPDPEPYCVMYEITKVSAACKSNTPNWQFENDEVDYQRFDRAVGHQPSGNVVQEASVQAFNHLVHPRFISHEINPGQQICATCYPRYMRPELGNRCPGTGYPGLASRWRALYKHDCQGTFRMVNAPRRACTCDAGSNAFIFT